MVYDIDEQEKAAMDLSQTNINKTSVNTLS